MNGYMKHVTTNIIVYIVFGVAMKKEGKCLNNNMHLSILCVKDDLHNDLL